MNVPLTPVEEHHRQQMAKTMRVQIDSRCCKLTIIPYAERVIVFFTVHNALKIMSYSERVAFDKFLMEQVQMCANDLHLLQATDPRYALPTPTTRYEELKTGHGVYILRTYSEDLNYQLRYTVVVYRDPKAEQLAARLQLFISSFLPKWRERFARV